MMKRVFVLIAMMFLWTGVNAEDGKGVVKSVDSRPNPNVNVQEYTEGWAPTIKTGISISDSRIRATVTSDGKSLFSLKDGVIYHWKLGSMKLLKRFKVFIPNKQLRAVQPYMSHDGKRMLLSKPYSKLQIWDVTTGKLITEKEYPHSYVTSSEYGFITLNMDNTVSVLDDRTLEPLKHIAPHTNEKLLSLFSGKNILVLRSAAEYIAVDLKTSEIIRKGEIVLNDASTLDSFMTEFSDKFCSKWQAHILSRSVFHPHYPYIYGCFPSNSKDSIMISTSPLGSKSIHLDLTKGGDSSGSRWMDFFQYKDKAFLYGSKYFSCTEGFPRERLKMRKNSQNLPMSDDVFKNFYKLDLVKEYYGNN